MTVWGVEVREKKPVDDGAGVAVAVDGGAGVGPEGLGSSHWSGNPRKSGDPTLSGGRTTEAVAGAGGGDDDSGGEAGVEGTGVAGFVVLACELWARR